MGLEGSGLEWLVISDPSGSCVLVLIRECLLIEPTETESLRELDNFVAVMAQIRQEIATDSECVKRAPSTQSVGRLDEVRAVKQLDIAYCF